MNMVAPPEHSLQHWPKIRELFDELIERSPGERETMLAGLLPDPAVLKETRELLAAADRSGDFMTVLPVLEVTPAASYRSLALGAQVGVFAVEAIVGRGGHGEVYRAFRTDGQFEQRVALKLLRPEALSQFENFRAERQILAGLEHSGIARLIDGGIAPDGRPYMAMEFVEGEPIDVFCRTVPLARRIRLVIEVCAAVAYAHANLIVHGDIKPGNVLVTPDGQAKLLDFGIARLIETNQITSGLTVALSTPAYAAPEQLAGKRATIATDIYALGAVLYEVLTGTAAWQLGDSPVSWASRILNDEPPLPSGVKRQGAGIEPAALRGDLDAIASKAMRARPDARYETVPTLAEDLRRYLERRPVLARNGNAAYRIGRFVRRNAIAVTATVLVLATVLGGGAAVGWNMQRAEANRVSARIEAIRGESMRDFMALLFRAMDAHPEGLHTARDILDASAVQLAADAKAGPVNPQLVRAVGELYFEVEEFVAARPFLEQFLATGDRSDPVLVAEVNRLLASIAFQQGDVAKAEALMAEAGAFFAANPTLYARERAELDGLRAAILRQTGHRDEGIALLRKTVADLTDILGPTSIDVLSLQQNLAVHLQDSGDLPDASALLAAVLDALKATGREQSSVALAALSAQGVIATRQSDRERAVALYAKAVALRKHIYSPSASLVPLELNYARGLSDLGRHEEALAVYDEAIAVSAAATGKDGAQYGVLLTNRGLSHVALGQLDAAAADINEALDRLKASSGTESQYYGVALFARAQLMFARGDYVAARADLDRARPLFEAMGPGGQAYIGMIGQVGQMIDAASGQP
jgi:non-specific serine/threonine protein kinase/serine/threonine-protein kinase